MLETFLTTIASRMLRTREPTIAEMLSDSIVQAIMQADGVDPHALEKALQDAAIHCASPYSLTAHR